MSNKAVSLITRIEQANNRLKHICLLYYRNEITQEDFRAEREEILDFIQKAFQK